MKFSPLVDVTLAARISGSVSVTLIQKKTITFIQYYNAQKLKNPGMAAEDMLGVEGVFLIF
jgi:hypothetical protein